MYTCPVCAYNRLQRPPEDFLICPSCGTEFGYDDFATTHEELREQWIAAGAPWFSDATRPPAGWDPIAQLVKAGLVPKTTAIGISTSAANLVVGHMAGIYTSPLMPILEPHQDALDDVQYVELDFAAA